MVRVDHISSETIARTVAVLCIFISSNTSGTCSASQGCVSAVVMFLVLLGEIRVHARVSAVHHVALVRASGISVVHLLGLRLDTRIDNIA